MRVTLKVWYNTLSGGSNVIIWGLKSGSQTSLRKDPIYIKTKGEDEEREPGPGGACL